MGNVRLFVNAWILWSGLQNIDQQETYDFFKATVFYEDIGAGAKSVEFLARAHGRSLKRDTSVWFLR